MDDRDMPAPPRPACRVCRSGRPEGGCEDCRGGGMPSDLAYQHDLRSAVRVAAWLSAVGTPTAPTAVVTVLRPHVRYAPPWGDEELSAAETAVAYQDDRERERLARLGNPLARELARLVAGEVGGVRVVLVRPDAVAYSSVRRDHTGAAAEGKATVRYWRDAMGLTGAPYLQGRELKELYRVAGSFLRKAAGPVIPDADDEVTSAGVAAAVEGLAEETASTDDTMVVVRQCRRWRVPDAFVEALVSRRGSDAVSEMLGPDVGEWPGGEPAEVLDGIVDRALRRVPVPRECVLLRAVVGDGGVRPEEAVLFPPGAVPGAIARVVITAPPLPAEELVLPVSTRGPGGQRIPVTVATTRLAPGERATLTAELVDSHQVTLSRDGVELAAGAMPERLVPAALPPVPALDLVGLVELHRGRGQGASERRLDFVAELLARVHAEYASLVDLNAAGPLRVGLVGYGAHLRGAYDDRPRRMAFGSVGEAQRLLAEWRASLPDGERSAAAAMEDAFVAANDLWAQSAVPAAARRVVVLLGKRPAYPPRSEPRSGVTRCENGLVAADELARLINERRVEVFVVRHDRGVVMKERAVQDYVKAAWSPVVSRATRTLSVGGDEAIAWPALTDSLLAPLTRLPRSRLVSIDGDVW